MIRVWSWPRQSKWARRRSRARADLTDEAWISPPLETFPGVLTAKLFAAHGLRLPRAPLTTLSIHLCCRLTSSGHFVTLLPASILRFGSYA
jgi:DNA-binding transcriptional LysR family regulator